MATILDSERKESNDRVLQDRTAGAQADAIVIDQFYSELITKGISADHALALTLAWMQSNWGS